MPSPSWFTGAAGQEALNVRTSTSGREREDVIRSCVAETLASMRRRHPDLKPESIVVDVTDVPGAPSVTWTLHTGDRVAPATVSLWTHRHNALEYARPGLTCG